MGRWYIEFDAVNPNSPDKKWKTGVLESLYRKIRNCGHEKAIARLLLVREVLDEGAVAIFSGWSRPDRDDCFVYLGHPDHDFKSLSIETPPPLKMGFLVFVLPDGTIDEWTWRSLHEEGDIRPNGVSGELIWSLKQS